LVLSSAHTEADVVEKPTRRLVGKKINLLSVGRLNTVKNHELLIRCLPILLSKHPNLLLRIVGAGPKANFLNRLAKDLCVSEFVELVGSIPHDDLWNEYDNADIFILPSLSEGTPKVVLEAMARGCPVIAADVSGVSTAVENESRGLLFPSRDSKALIACVDRLISDSELREKCQLRAANFAQEQTIEATTERMLNIVSATWEDILPLKNRSGAV